MRVDVLCFGMLRELMGGERRSCELNSGTSVGALLAELEPAVGGAVWRSIAVAVNQEYAGLETVLVEGDEVALLPPVSGGGDAG